MSNDGIAGDEPLADGMHIAVRVRRDFTVTDAGRLLAAARAAWVQLNPWATAREAEAAVTSAADAISTIAESAGLATCSRCPRIPEAITDSTSAA